MVGDSAGFGGFKNGRLKVTKPSTRSPITRKPKRKPGKGPGKILGGGDQKVVKDHDDAMVRKIQVALDQQDALEQRRELENGVKIDQHQFEKALEEDEETEDWSSDSAQLKTKAIEAIGDSDATGRRKETRDAVVPENARADKQGPQQRGCRETASTAMQENFKNSSKPLVGGVAHCPTAAINESLKAQKKGGNVVDEHVPCLYGSHIQTRVTETGRPVFRALKREEIEERNKLLKGQKCYCEACTKRDVESQKERAKGMWVEDHGNVRGL